MTDAESPTPAATDDSAGAAPYRVLARKYRPTTFAGLIGQEVVVRTLTNAFDMDRLAHAYILTGVRGVGKTSTARIIARALNCIGPDGSGGPTPEPCGECANCVAIAEDRHVDVLEMDAASRTGVDDIRELIDGVRYRPTSARFKVYIIDEVHMLSKNAFNALLKTLEEPPPHVKFIFATTEIRKVPVTVLSRCQRFDLARVDVATLGAHFRSVAEQENAPISETALDLIARAADGSVRDGLSLLDQAISQTSEEISEPLVRDMLGLADRSQTFTLLKAALSGEAGTALETFDRLYADGADPLAILEDMLDISHWLTRAKIAPEILEAPQTPEIERKEGGDMAARLSMAALARTWQVLLKGLGEVRMAPSPRQAAEMVLIRLAYTANLPTPEEALKSLENDGTASSPAPAAAPAPSPAAAPMPTGSAVAAAPAEPEPAADPAPEPQPAPAMATPVKAAPESLEDVLALADANREGMLRTHLVNDFHLVHFEPGRIEFRPGVGAPRDLAGRLGAFLNEHTAIRWMVTVSSEEGAETLQQVRDREVESIKAEAAKEPLVQAVLETFPEARIDTVTKRGATVDKEEPGDPEPE